MDFVALKPYGSEKCVGGLYRCGCILKTKTSFIFWYS